jgi:hypothetical protein
MGYACSEEVKKQRGKSFAKDFGYGNAPLCRVHIFAI